LGAIWSICCGPYRSAAHLHDTRNFLDAKHFLFHQVVKKPKDLEAWGITVAHELIKFVQILRDLEGAQQVRFQVIVFPDAVYALVRHDEIGNATVLTPYDWDSLMHYRMERVLRLDAEFADFHDHSPRVFIGKLDTHPRTLRYFQRGSVRQLSPQVNWFCWSL
jgi:hypothetical protein